MTHQAESSLQQTAAYYSPLPLEVVSYGPKLEDIEQDGYRHAGEDDADNSLPLLDSYAGSFDLPRTGENPITNRRSEISRPGTGQRLAWDEKHNPLVATGPHYRFDSLGGIQLRE